LPRVFLPHVAVARNFLLDDLSLGVAVCSCYSANHKSLGVTPSF
jgi:hypothetical protein